MVSWGQFTQAAPDLEAAGRALLYRYGVGPAFLATADAVCGPRVHLVSPLLLTAGLYVS